MARMVAAALATRSDRYTQDVFRSLGDRESGLVQSLAGRSISLPQNRALVNEGEVGAGLYRLDRGWAFRYRAGCDGCRQILDFLLPGEIIGLQGALLGVAEHSVRSLTALRVSAFDARLVADAF